LVHYTCQVGKRVQVLLPCGVETGIIRYNGHTLFREGEWLGIELDSPEGVNNGTVSGVYYFDCLKNHGIFTRQDKIHRVSDSDPSQFTKNFVVDTRKPEGKEKNILLRICFNDQSIVLTKYRKGRKLVRTFAFSECVSLKKDINGRITLVFSANSSYRKSFYFTSKKEKELFCTILRLGISEGKKLITQFNKQLEATDGKNPQPHFISFIMENFNTQSQQKKFSRKKPEMVTFRQSSTLDCTFSPHEDEVVEILHNNGKWTKAKIISTDNVSKLYSVQWFDQGQKFEKQVAKDELRRICQEKKKSIEISSSDEGQEKQEIGSSNDLSNSKKKNYSFARLLRRPTYDNIPTKQSTDHLEGQTYDNTGDSKEIEENSTKALQDMKELIVKFNTRFKAIEKSIDVVNSRIDQMNSNFEERVKKIISGIMETLFTSQQKINHQFEEQIKETQETIRTRVLSSQSSIHSIPETNKFSDTKFEPSRRKSFSDSIQPNPDNTKNRGRSSTATFLYPAGPTTQGSSTNHVYSPEINRRTETPFQHNYQRSKSPPNQVFRTHTPTRRHTVITCEMPSRSPRLTPHTLSGSPSGHASRGRSKGRQSADHVPPNLELQPRAMSIDRGRRKYSYNEITYHETKRSASIERGSGSSNLSQNKSSDLLRSRILPSSPATKSRNKPSFHENARCLPLSPKKNVGRRKSSYQETVSNTRSKQNPNSDLHKSRSHTPNRRPSLISYAEQVSNTRSIDYVQSLPSQLLIPNSNSDGHRSSTTAGSNSMPRLSPTLLPRANTTPNPKIPVESATTIVMKPRIVDKWEGSVFVPSKSEYAQGTRHNNTEAAIIPM